MPEVHLFLSLRQNLHRTLPGRSVLDPRFGAATAQWGSFHCVTVPPTAVEGIARQREFTRVNDGPGRCFSGGRIASVCMSLRSDMAAHESKGRDMWWALGIGGIL